MGWGEMEKEVYGSMEWAMREAKWLFGRGGDVNVKNNGECVVGYVGPNGVIKGVGKGKDWKGAVEEARRKKSANN